MVRISKNILVARRFLLVVVCMAVGACLTSLRKPTHRPPRNRAPEIVVLEATGYCACGKCCGWRRNWLLQPVVAYGPNKGKPKKVGVTAAGTRARVGTIAADTRRFPFGTIMEIPGYGVGRVEDRGSAIQGNRIDLFFRNHAEALEWGRQTLRVNVWRPQ